jgi:predicted ATPase
LGRGIRGKRRSDGFFFRAESFYNVATEIERLQFDHAKSPYGATSYHDQSHGEALLNLFVNRLRGDGLYLLDEPEAALSPQRQLTFLAASDRLLARVPNAQIWLRRIGSRYVRHFGPRPRSRRP